MTSLLVPEHIHIRRQAEKAAAEAAAKKAAEAAPTMDKAAVDRLPQPTGWRILILPFQGKKQSAGGIVIPDQVRERESLATVCGYVLRMGPDCYKDKERFPGGPWCKEGQWVVFGRYAGSRFKIEDGEVRIVNDDEILGTIADPNDIIHV